MYFIQKALLAEFSSNVKCPADSCFPNVVCDLKDGIAQCGACPAGHIGDGRYCEKIVTCEEKPCYSGKKPEM